MLYIQKRFSPLFSLCMVAGTLVILAHFGVVGARRGRPQRQLVNDDVNHHQGSGMVRCHRYHTGNIRGDIGRTAVTTFERQRG